MRNQGVEIAIQSLSPDAWISVEGTQPRDYCRLSCLPRPPRAFRVCLRDAAGLVDGKPDGVECPWVGRVFGEVLKQLYDGNRWRMNLPLSVSHVVFQIVRLVGEDMGRWQDGLYRYGSARRLSHGFKMLEPNPDDPDDPYRTDYWWCPKRSLSSVLADIWSYPTSGYAAPRPDRGALEACMRSEGSAGVLDSLLSLCRFVFQWADDGEAMVVLSHQVTRDVVERAVQSPPVRRALRDLNERALLVEWRQKREELAGDVCIVYEKPRPGGSGVRRVHRAAGKPKS